MEWLWILAIVVLLFCIFMIIMSYRVMYIKGFKDGGMRVLNEWRQFEEGIENDEHI